jgi:sugar (pentulose or hexulose) kinase
LGTLKVNGRNLPLFGGFGDMQTAIFGAGVPERATAAVIVGTGSQIARAVARPLPTVERRPFFGGTELAAITHIPAGRALDIFARWFDDIALAAGGGRDSFWKLFGELSEEQILEAPLIVDLNLFAGAWRYRDGGSIWRITEASASAAALVASVARGWLAQYAHAFDVIDPKREEQRFVLAGGLAQRCPATAAVLEKLTSRRVVRSGSRVDETIAGLAALAGNAARQRARA